MSYSTSRSATHILVAMLALGRFSLTSVHRCLWDVKKKVGLCW